LAPSQPETLFTAFARALGAVQAHTWFRQYQAALETGALPEQEWMSREALAQLLQGKAC
jgi:hypothetical protein